jgi:hypothetical protein
MLEAMLEASDHTSCYKVYFTKNAANTKDSTHSKSDSLHNFHTVLLFKIEPIQTHLQIAYGLTNIR